ncbi:hypothetical protein ACA910_018024 [Epithemia clementina (nom. ined.)]
MVQSLNTKAILTLASVLRRPLLMVPHVSVASVSDLDFEALQQHAGICAVVFDKDNTLTLPYETTQIHPKAQAGLESARRVFGSQGVAILSNSAGTVQDDPNFVEAQAIEENLGIAVIRHAEKKPGGLPEVLQHFAPVLLSRFCSEPTPPDHDDHTGGRSDNSSWTTAADRPPPPVLASSTAAPRLCMIGDRILTDVVFGNLYGMLTVHVTHPLAVTAEERARDNWTARLLRPLEQRLVYSPTRRHYDNDNHNHHPNPHERTLLWTPRQAPKPHLYWPGPATCPLVLSSAAAAAPPPPPPQGRE